MRIVRAKTMRCFDDSGANQTAFHCLCTIALSAGEQHVTALPNSSSALPTAANITSTSVTAVSVVTAADDFRSSVVENRGAAPTVDDGLVAGRRREAPSAAAIDEPPRFDTDVAILQARCADLTVFR